MALITVSLVDGHQTSMTKCRGRGAPGGWRWAPTCSCGWPNQTRTFMQSFGDRAMAYEAMGEHICSVDWQTQYSLKVEVT